MHHRHPPIYDVVIAGAGPVGLLLACELRLAGVSVQILEQTDDPYSPLKGLPFGMRGLSVPTAEAFYRRGLLDGLVALLSRKADSDASGASHGAHWMHQPRRPGGHFAGIPFFQDNVRVANWTHRLPDAATGTVIADMESIETLLTERAVAMGVDIKRGLGVQNVDQSSDRVAILAGDQMFYGKWLVGCDGGRSRVRKVAGFDFVGTDAAFTGYSLQVTLADPDTLMAGRHYTPTGMYTYQKPGTIAMVDFDKGAFHRTQPITLAHVQTVLRHITNTHVTVTSLQLATTWTDRAYQATAYRNGKVFLAGDAAHIHSPLGGQGLNLGLGDAMNLGWKLAATIRGHAPETLLDSYFSERHPIGAQILDWSRAQVALMRPSRSASALASVMRDLIETGDGATYFAERIWGVSLRYDLGDQHPLVGRSAPDVALADGSRLGDYLRNGKGVLLDLGNDLHIKALTSRWGDRIAYVGSQAGDSLGVKTMLVRPDGFVAWAADASVDLPQLTQSVSHWFGEPESP